MVLKKLKLGNIILPTNIIYASLSGYTDFSFRKIASKFHRGLMFCEMVKMDALIRHDENTYNTLAFDESMHPIGAQIFGKCKKLAAKSAKIIESLGFDVIELNCGCPADKVTKDGSGAALLKNPELIGDILSNIVAQVSIPVTVKIRAGIDSNNINADKITKIAEESGAKAITIHGRTKNQKYRGYSNLDYIKMCKDCAKKIKVIANGDIFDSADMQKAFNYTNCDGVVLARGILGRPWIGSEEFLLNEKVFDKNKSILILLKHLDMIKNYNNDKKAFLCAKSHVFWYLKRLNNIKNLKLSVVNSNNILEIKEILLKNVN